MTAGHHIWCLRTARLECFKKIAIHLYSIRYLSWIWTSNNFNFISNSEYTLLNELFRRFNGEDISNEKSTENGRLEWSRNIFLFLEFNFSNRFERKLSLKNEKSTHLQFNGLNQEICRLFMQYALKRFLNSMEFLKKCLLISSEY